MTTLEMFESAMVLEKSGDTVGCIQALNKLLMIDPHYAWAWNNRAIMMMRLGHAFDAVMNSDYAIKEMPLAEFYNTRGGAYLDLEMFDKALEDFNKSIELKPDFAVAMMNKGNLFMKIRETKNAISAYRNSITSNSGYVDSHLGLAFALMEDGKYKEGSLEYDWRWKSSQCPSRGLGVKEWNGEAAASANDGLLFYSEQGHGDALQFMRFAKMVKAQWGGKVYVEVKQPLVRVAQTLSGIDGVITFGERPPINITRALPMMSAMKFMTDFQSRPYLKADPYRTNIWKQKLSQLPIGFKIGVCWSGGARPYHPIANAVNNRRSTTFDTFAPLAVPGVSWVSLQVGPEAHQVKTPPLGIKIGDWSDELYDFYDTAALIECLDLVISVDTSVVHLAGALGKPVWLLSRYDNCWRWHNGAENSPWYPSLRQFRQPSNGDWCGMMNEAAGELRKLVSQRMAA